MTEQMTDDEIRMAIAEVKDWIFPQTIRRQVRVTHEMAIDAGMPEQEGSIIDWGEKYIEGDGELPDWSRNIASAWELVEEMIVNGHQTILYSDHFSHVFKILEHRFGGNVLAAAQDSTAPRAICLAWLEWKKGQEAKG